MKKVKKLKLEYSTLKSKVENFFDYLQSDKFQKLDEYEQTLLTIQYCSMKSYFEALELRIRYRLKKK